MIPSKCVDTNLYIIIISYRNLEREASHFCMCIYEWVFICIMCRSVYVIRMTCLIIPRSHDVYQPDPHNIRCVSTTIVLFISHHINLC